MLLLFFYDNVIDVHRIYIYTFSSPVIIKGPACSRSFAHLYVPPFSAMEIQTPLRRGKYPKNSNCGWIGWVSVQFIAFNDGRNSIEAGCGSKYEF